ncbi:hypothetical protein [Amycolatopsis sp. NPDC059657]|uniref:hypothetical protein n=1 Tax=Amycolatopsis sp. NPDC059657 TaxID=3346899 RepID=UPI003671C4B4
MSAYCNDCHRPLAEGAVCSCAYTRSWYSGAADRIETGRNTRMVTLVAIGAAVVIAVAVLVVVTMKNSPAPVVVTGQDRVVANMQASTQTEYVPYVPPPATVTTVQRPPTTVISDSLRTLRSYAAGDLGTLRATANGRWVAQLSSKQPGTVAHGMRYDTDMILSEHLTLRSRYPGSLLVWTGDWPSYKNPDYWATVGGTVYATPEAANAWCDQQGFPKDDCYAKRLRTTGGPDGNTKLR